jgi:hypothetical protein
MPNRDQPSTGTDRGDDGETERRDRQTRGGYPAGGKQISEFAPPPKGPAPGGRRPEPPERADPQSPD